MKKLAGALTVLLLGVSAFNAKGQYYEAASQLTNLISPALSGSLNYRGFVEVSGLAGFGDNRANFIGISTTQGFQYADWFFMGAGIGIDLAIGHENEYDYDYPPFHRPNSDTKRAMLPVFSDFRFNFGGQSSTSFFADLKIGAAWILGDRYLQMNRDCLSNNTQFYLRPSVGVRIPTDSKNPRHAFNIAVTYQLLTANQSYYDNVSVSSIGVTMGYEW